MYEWKQDYEGINIIIPVSDDASIKNISISTQRQYIKITIGACNIIDNELYAEIYGDETIWYLESDPDGKTLNINLRKVPKPNCYGWWTKLLTVDEESENVPDMRPISDFTPESQSKIVKSYQQYYDNREKLQM